MNENHHYPWSRVALYLILGIAGCFVDLLTKKLVFDHDGFYPGSEWWLVQDHIGIQKSLNEGGLFGMGQGKVWLLAPFSLIALVAIPTWLFRFRAAQDRLITVAMGLVTGGVLGNLYDRLGLHGLIWQNYVTNRGGERVHAVRDWILFQWNDQWIWPNFNVADMLLVAGAALLLLHTYAMERPKSATNESNSATSS